MKKEIITSVDPKSPISEIFRTLRTNLQYLNKKNGAETVLLTSTLQGEGKSFVAANLAVTFAQAGRNTIVVDTDMRRPRQHKLLNVDMYPGLSNYLSGVNINRGTHTILLKECIYKSTVPNLSVMPAGNIPPNPSELLQSERLGEMIKELKSRFDVVIFDGAPCLLVTDATLVSRLVDATVLVVSQKNTKVDDLKEVKNRIKRVGGNIVGVILNKVKVSNKKYGEKYYYYSNSTLQERTRRRQEAETDDDEEELETNHYNQEKQPRTNRFKKNKKFNKRNATISYKRRYEERNESTPKAKENKVENIQGSIQGKTVENIQEKTEENKAESVKNENFNKNFSEKPNESFEKNTNIVNKKNIHLNENEATSDKIKQIIDEINRLKEENK